MSAVAAGGEPSGAAGGEPSGAVEAVGSELLARVHAIEPRSRANGPGARFVIWLQGCTLGCPGCFNPTTHTESGGQLRPVAELLAELASAARGGESIEPRDPTRTGGPIEARDPMRAGGRIEARDPTRGGANDPAWPGQRGRASPLSIEGLTLSGGEPMQQPAAAAALLAGARALGLSTLVFSGYTREEIEQLPEGPAALASIDVLVDGRYRSTERLGAGLRGSANQRILLLSDRYTLADVEATPVAEIRISREGELVLTGVNPLKLKR